MTVTWRLAEADEARERTRSCDHGTASRINAVARRFHAWLAARREQRRTRRLLAGLDDRMLDDIGIRRAEIGPDAGDLRGIADVLALLTETDRPR